MDILDNFREHLLHDFVHCVVCQNIYQDPQQLPCLHTFCAACVTRLTQVGSGGVMSFTGTRSRNVSCPMCREEVPVSGIKPDFRTNDLVSRYQNVPVYASEYPCGACAEESRDMEWKCVTCNMLICGCCKDAHSRFPPTADHRIISVEEVARVAKEELAKRKESFVKADDSLLKQLNTFNYYKEHVLNQKLQAEAKIDHDCRDLIRKFTDFVTACGSTMKQAVASADVNENTKITQQMSEIVSTRQRHADAQRRIQELLEWEDEKKVASESHNGLLQDPEIHQDKYDIKEKLVLQSPDDFVSNILQAVLRNKPNLTAGMEDFGNPDIHRSPLNKGRLSMLPLTMQSSSQWKPIQKYELKHNFQRICIVGDNIWICISSLHAISLFSVKEGKMVKHIKHDGIRYPMAVASTSEGSVIVACAENKGLVAMSSLGEYKSHIEQSGSYHDISICGNDMAVLDVVTGLISVYLFKDSNWTKKYEVKPEVNDPLNSILMHYGLLVVGSIKGEEEDRVVVYEDGKVLRKYQIAGDFVRVCCTDPNQSILVSHGRDNNLLVLRSTGEIEQLIIANGVFYPLDVVFSDDVTMWVIQRTAQGTAVLKCTKN